MGAVSASCGCDLELSATCHGTQRSCGGTHRSLHGCKQCFLALSGGTSVPAMHARGSSTGSLHVLDSDLVTRLRCCTAEVHRTRGLWAGCMQHATADFGNARPGIHLLGQCHPCLDPCPCYRAKLGPLARRATCVRKWLSRRAQARRCRYPRAHFITERAAGVTGGSSRPMHFVTLATSGRQQAEGVLVHCQQL